ncbi:hypothetical protein JCM10212_005241 [Sporobolomyces blumeae]
MAPMDDEPPPLSTSTSTAVPILLPSTSAYSRLDYPADPVDAARGPGTSGLAKPSISKAFHPGGARYEGSTAVGRIKATLRKPRVVLAALATCALVGYYVNGGPGGRAESSASTTSTGNDHGYGFSFDRLSHGTWPFTPRPSSNDDGEWGCNPFEQNGRLNVDLEHPKETRWVPFDARCKSSNLMTGLYRPPGDMGPLIPERVRDKDKVPTTERAGERTFYPWFRNRTVVLHGDSIDRFHLKDFCEFVGGRLELVTPDHPASPAMWKKPNADPLRREQEERWQNRPREGWELTQPWICDVQEYGTTIVNVFTWGLEGAEEFFEMERWYYPPATWVERMDHITLPLLPRLAKYLDRPEIENPDLVILNSGYWDLRKYTEEDFVAAGFPTRPYPEDSPIPYTPLSPGREQAWEREARKAIKHAAKSFRGKEGKAKNGPPLLWRSLHHPPRHNYAPFPRVFQLDSLARKVVSDLRLAQVPSSSSSPYSPSDPLSPLAELEDREDLGLATRLRIDESGKLMLGQEHLFRDLLHPLPVPGSWLWADIMLYELKRAVEGVDR